MLFTLNPIKICILGLFLSRAAAALLRGGQPIPAALYHECRGGDLAELCKPIIERAWNEGHLQAFNSTHQFYTPVSGSCKITYWSDNEENVKVQSLDDITEAVMQISQVCAQDKRPVFKHNQEGVRGSRNLFIGQLSREYVVIAFDGLGLV